MKKLFPAILLSLALSVSLLPGLAFSATEEGLTLGVPSDAPTTLATQAKACKKHRITVKRAAKGEVAIKVGKTYKLGAKVTAGKLLYKSSNRKVATVTSKGTVKAKKAGKATITIIAINCCKKVSKKVSVTVVPANEYKAVKKLEMLLPNKYLRVGMTEEAVPDILPFSASNRNVVYTSSNPKVLTVSVFGMVKAKSRARRGLR